MNNKTVRDIYRGIHKFKNLSIITKVNFEAFMAAIF
jgi:hypothetical protein